MAAPESAVNRMYDGWKPHDLDFQTARYRRHGMCKMCLRMGVMSRSCMWIRCFLQSRARFATFAILTCQ